ncbi:MAG: sulfite oxidase heme-binding subunit YedZ [Burkholderiales bacterium]
MWQPRARQLAAIRTALFALCLVPFAHLVWGIVYDTLGANPVEAVTHSTGWWTLFLLCATLAVTPLRRATGANWLLKLRRMLGLYAYFYVALHFLTYIWLDQWFDVVAIAADVLKRPYITVGFTAFLLLIPLAATSTDAMQRRLGRKWQRVHRFIYLIAVLGVLHFWWLVKRDVTEPALFALVVAGLLGMRLFWSLRRRMRVARPAVATSGG